MGPIAPRKEYLLPIRGPQWHGGNAERLHRRGGSHAALYS
jgi:hypothetical protein